MVDITQEILEATFKKYAFDNANGIPYSPNIIRFVGEALEFIASNLTWHGFEPLDAEIGLIASRYYAKHKTFLSWQLEKWIVPHDANGRCYQINEQSYASAEKNLDAPRLAKYWRAIDQKVKMKQKETKS